MEMLVFTPVFSYIYSWVLIFVLSPFFYLDLYLLGDDASIRSFMETNHLFVLIHIRNKVEVGTIKLV